MPVTAVRDKGALRMWVCRLPVHIGPLRNSEFAADFRKIRCGLRADRVVRPYRVRGIENFFVGADDSVGPLRSYEFV